MHNGVLIIDKPEGLSSAQVVARIKKGIHARKVGHAGTLDPFATGVLVCLVNQATRLAQFLLSAGKSYDAVLHLGAETDTQDRTGQVIRERVVPDIREEDIRQAFNRFIGDFEQMPPVYSALKHKGVALYKLARRGQSIQKSARRVHIEAIRIHEIQLPRIRFSVSCSAGTYIRTLCADIGKLLGCGGHLSELRRTMSSGFGIEEAVSLDRLIQVAGDPQWRLPLIPPGEALREMPALKADRATAAKIKCGGMINVRDFTDLPPDATVMTNGDKGTYYKVLDHSEKLIAVVSADPQKNRMVYQGVFA